MTSLGFMDIKVEGQYERGISMTGRDLIIYILANKLEDEPIYNDGKILGLMTAGEAAEKMNVGIATIHAWIHQGWLNCVVIGGKVYIPANFKSPVENIL